MRRRRNWYNPPHGPLPRRRSRPMEAGSRLDDLLQGATPPRPARRRKGDAHLPVGGSCPRRLLARLRGVPPPHPLDGVREELLLGVADAVAGPAAEQVLVLVAP